MLRGPRILLAMLLAPHIDAGEAASTGRAENREGMHLLRSIDAFGIFIAASIMRTAPAGHLYRAT